MSYRNKVVYTSLACFAFLGLWSYVSEVTGGGSVHFGEVALSWWLFSVAESILLVLVGIILLIVHRLRPGGGQNARLGSDQDRVLDLDPALDKDLPAHRSAIGWAGPFFVSAGLVLLVGTSACMGGITLG